MKATLELPDALMKRVKLRAVHRRNKLKDEIAQLLELGLASAAHRAGPVTLPKPVMLQGRGLLNIEQIGAAIASGHE